MTFAFDPLKYTQGAVKIGMPREQAEYNAEQFYKLISVDLATKKDLEKVEINLKKDMDQLELSLKKDIKNLEISLKKDILLVEESFSSKLEKMELRMTIKLGSMITGAIALLGIVQHFFK